MFSISPQKDDIIESSSSAPSAFTYSKSNMPDLKVEFPFTNSQCVLHIFSKHCFEMQNALTASKLALIEVDTLMKMIQENTKKEKDHLEKDEFLELIKLIPLLNLGGGGETFRRTEQILERIYLIFQLANKLELKQLGIACLPLVNGSMKEKIAAAIKLSVLASITTGTGTGIAGVLSSSVLINAFQCLVLSLFAIFMQDHASHEFLKDIVTKVTECVKQTVANFFTWYGVSKEEEVTTTLVWNWLEHNLHKIVPWAKLLDQKKWPLKKTVLSPSASKQAPTADAVTGELDDNQRSLSFRFSSVDGGVMTLKEPHAKKLYSILVESSFTRLTPKCMYTTFVQHTSDGLLEEESFLEAMDEIMSLSEKPDMMANDKFLDQMLSLFRSFLSEKDYAKVDAIELAAGFSLFTWDPKSDKLWAAFHYFDADNKGFLNRHELWRFLRSIIITLLYFASPNEDIIAQYGSISELVDTGEEELMENIAEGVEAEEVERLSESNSTTNIKVSHMSYGIYTFEDFGQWYNSGGYEGLGWLELLDLKKWAYVWSGFEGEQLNTEVVDPQAPPKSYYQQNNIQVHVLPEIVETTGEDLDRHTKSPTHEQNENLNEEQDDGYFELTKDKYDVEEDYEEGNSHQEPEDSNVQVYSRTGTRAKRNRLGGFGRTSMLAFPNETSPRQSGDNVVHSTLPAICLKNEVILEFDLPVDSDDDAYADLPLTVLCFDNGDLIHYSELQRVIRLGDIPVYRVFEVFEPFMNIDGGSDGIEKDTFDVCIAALLPEEVAEGLQALAQVKQVLLGEEEEEDEYLPSSRKSVILGVKGPQFIKDLKMVADTLSRLFFAFNRNGTGKIDLVEFASAFSIFCGGSKSEKLSFAFRLFDTDRDGNLSSREMWKYLRSFLTILLALGNGAELSAEAIANVANTTAIEITKAIFGTLHKQSQPTRRGSTSSQLQRMSSSTMKGMCVSFQEFAKWYSVKGFNLIAWVELLDTKKWPVVDQEIRDAIVRYNSRQQEIMAAAVAGTNKAHSTVNSSYHSGDDSSSRNGADSPLPASGHKDHRRTNQPSFEEGVTPNEEAVEDAATVSASRRQRNNGINKANTLSTADTTSTVDSPTPPKSSRDLNSVALQFKLTDYDNTMLRIRLKDVAIVYTIAERMNLSSMTCDELFEAFELYTQGRSLSKTGYLKTLRSLVPRDTLTNEDQEFLSFHLIRVFTLYEAESIEDEEKDEEDEEEEEEENEDDESLQISSSVDKRHLFAGMSVFCGYSKSVKLGSLFKLFDFVGDGFLTRRMFFDMLKSILSVLFAFSGLGANRCHANDTSSTNNWSTTSAAERAAGAVVSKVFSESRRVHADAICLTEFAQWYAQGGYLTCSWLELLDLSKWPAKEAFEASKKEKPLIYAFDMLEEGSILQFTKSDIATYLYMLRMTKLKEQPVNKIYDALMSYATPPIGDERGRGGHGGNAEGHEPGKAGNSYSYAAMEEDEGAYLVITRQNFYNCIRSLVPRGEMSDKAQQTSSKLLSRMFNVYDRKRCGRVNALELACGLSIIGLGSKSQKLAMAFNFITKLRQQRSRVLNSQYTAAYMTGNGTLKGLHDPGDEVTFLSQGNVKRAGVPHAGEASDELASLPHSVLFIYLRSFLLVLMSLSDSTYRLGLEKIYVEADDFIEEAMGDIMTEVAANGPGGGGNGPISVRSRARVTFQQFGEWYNNGGYELISWLELLDVSKWQQQQDFEEQTMNRTGQKSIHGRQNPHPHPEKQKNQQMSADGVKKRESNDKESPQKAKPSSPKKIDATDINSARKGNKKGKKTIRQSAICLPGDGPPAGGAPPPQKKSITELEEEKNENALAALSLASDGPIMVYAISHRNPVAELQFYNDDIDRLKLFQQQTHIHKVEALTFLANLRLASNALIGTSSSRDVVFSRDAFGGFFQKACTISIHSKSPVQVTEEGLELLNSIEEVFLKDMADVEDQEHKEDEEVVEFMKAACGMIVLTKDKLLEKLQAACGFYVNRNANATTNNKADSKAKEKKKNKKAGFTSPTSANDTTTISIAQQVPIEDFKQVLSYFLMALYAISCSLSNEVIRHSSTIGAGELVDFFLENQKEKLKPDNINIGDFTTWFWEEGSQKYPWLELVNTFEWPPKVATIRLKDAQLKRTGISG